MCFFLYTVNTLLVGLTDVTYNVGYPAYKDLLMSAQGCFTIAAYHYTRILNNWVEAPHYSYQGDN